MTLTASLDNPRWARLTCEGRNGGGLMRNRLTGARRAVQGMRRGVLFLLASVILSALISGCAKREAAGAAAPDAPAVAQQNHPGATPGASAVEPASGQQLYADICASCHDAPDTVRTPSFAGLKTMSPGQISFALKSGKMKAQAEGLGREEIAALVEFLAGAGRDEEIPESARCEGARITLTDAPVPGWGLNPSNTRRASPDQTRITRDTVASLEVAWTFGVPGVSEVRSQPVITTDTVFLATMAGDVFALGRDNGCVKWRAELGDPFRAPMALGRSDGEPTLLIANARSIVFALDPMTGATRWTSNAALFPESMSTSGIVQHNDLLVTPLSSMDVAAAMNPEHECCKSHGAVTALAAKTGERRWVAHMTENAKPTGTSSVGTQLWGPSGAPVWTTPAIDAANGRIYIGTGENTSMPATDTSDAIMALDLDTGDRLWTYQATREDTFNMACSPIGKDGPNCPKKEGPDYDFGGAVVFAADSQGRELVIGGQKSGVVHAVDARDGSLVWKTQVSSGSALGGVHWGLSVANGRVFAPSNDPPFPIPGYKARPGMAALDLDTGAILWRRDAKRGCRTNFLKHRSNDEPWPDCSFFYGFSAAPTSTDDLVFAAALDGRLFAFDAVDGETRWTYDTKRPFETVNGVAAHGGAIDNAGVQLADDMLFVQSGYSLFGQMPGNVLIAFRMRSDGPGGQ